ncbi:MAG TPA: hypothetical protein VFB41_06315 [Solirubrobacteraceae bacterium]|nr:hypothetical protein [Solirubrobacteraceae bacterium]
MGKRGRARGGGGKLRAQPSEYRDADGNVLVLRGSMSPLTRRRYAGILHDQSKSVDDSWQRGVEFLFERLAVRWVVHEVPTEGEQQLLLRYRMASQDERRWIRDTLREHLATHFPDIEAP